MENFMNEQTIRHTTTAPVPEDQPATFREMMKEQLNTIAAAVQAALREADLPHPIFFSVPSGGPAMITYATPLDPSEEVWKRISAIVCRVVGEQVGVEGLQGRPLPCAMAAGTMGAADLYKDHTYRSLPIFAGTAEC
jgi:hypothetical protein